MISRREVYNFTYCGCTVPKTLIKKINVELTCEEKEELLSILLIEQLRRYLEKGRERSVIKESGWLDDFIDNKTLATLDLGT